MHSSSLLSEVSFIYMAKENSTVELIYFARPNSAQLLVVLTLSLDFQISKAQIPLLTKPLFTLSEAF